MTRLQILFVAAAEQYFTLGRPVVLPVAATSAAANFFGFDLPFRRRKAGGYLRSQPFNTSGSINSTSTTIQPTNGRHLPSLPFSFPDIHPYRGRSPTPLPAGHGRALSAASDGAEESIILLGGGTPRCLLSGQALRTISNPMITNPAYTRLIAAAPSSSLHANKAHFFGPKTLYQTLMKIERR